MEHVTIFRRANYGQKTQRPCGGRSPMTLPRTVMTVVRRQLARSTLDADREQIGPDRTYANAVQPREPKQPHTGFVVGHEVCRPVVPSAPQPLTLSFIVTPHTSINLATADDTRAYVRNYLLPMISEPS